MDRSEFNRAQALAAQMAATVPPASNTQPVLGSKPHAAPARNHHPSSIAPVAFDTASRSLSLPPPSRGPSFAPPPNDDVPLQKKASALPWILGVAAAFVFVATSGSIAGYLLVTKTQAQSPALAVAAPPEPRAPERTSAVNPARPVVEKTAASELAPANVDSLPSIQAKATAAPVHQARALAPAKPIAEPKPVALTPPVVAEAPKPVTPAAPVSKSGTIHVALGSKALTIIVDGGYRRLTNGTAVVACGHHSVRAGSSTAHEIDVPCGGSVTLD